MSKGIQIGTSGWSYKHWKGDYYPAGLPASKWLPYYAEQFGATEINSSFYQLPSEKTISRWMEQVPAGFLFCPKMSRFLTHMKKLSDPEEPLERFFNLFKTMKVSLGPVLLQLPAMLKFNPDRTEHLYRLLKNKYRPYSFVMEVRHETWLSRESTAMMSRYGIGLVIAHSGEGFPYSETVTSKNVYVRFHGPKELYASRYSDKMLEIFAKKFLDWEKDGLVVWAFFNNDIHGFAPVDAARLKALVGQ